MLKNKIKSYLPIIGLGVLLGTLLSVLKLVEYSYFSYKIGSDVYIGIIAGFFMIFGIFLGSKYNIRRKTEVIKNLVNKSNILSNPDIDLTARELEILHIISRGHSNQEIADKLFVSLNTIKTHINNIYSKLNVKRRTQAVLKARELNIIP